MAMTMVTTLGWWQWRRRWRRRWWRWRWWCLDGRQGGKPLPATDPISLCCCLWIYTTICWCLSSRFLFFIHIHYVFFLMHTNIQLLRCVFLSDLWNCEIGLCKVAWFSSPSARRGKTNVLKFFDIVAYIYHPCLYGMGYDNDCTTCERQKRYKCNCVRFVEVARMLKLNVDSLLVSKW